MAPSSPKTRSQSLPPILRSPTHNSLIGYSKDARGLSVLWRASGVFTGTTNSLGELLRQSSDRYAIRAGRNLPDKEFATLGPLLLRPPFTGASVRSFACANTPFNLPAPGRRQPLYIVFDLAETCVFVKQSPDAIHCGPFAWAPLLPKLRG